MLLVSSTLNPSAGGVLWVLIQPFQCWDLVPEAESWGSEILLPPMALNASVSASIGLAEYSRERPATPAQKEPDAGTEVSFKDTIRLKWEGDQEGVNV